MRSAAAQVRADGVAHTPAYASTLRLVQDRSGAPLDHSSRYKVAILVEDADGNETLATLDAFTLDSSKPTVQLTVAHSSLVEITATASDAFDGSVGKIHYYAGATDIDPATLASLGSFVSGDSLAVSTSIPAESNTYVHVQAEDTASTLGAPANLLSDVSSSTTAVPVVSASFLQGNGYQLVSQPSVQAEVGPVAIHFAVFDGAVPDVAALSNLLASGGTFTSCNVFL